MTLNQLRYYQAVCEHNSISKASAALHVTQPAVSIALSNLEAEFGVTLFNRDNRLLEITEAGRIFLSLVNELLASVDAMYVQMEKLQNNTNLLRLSMVPFGFSKKFQNTIDAFRESSPETHMNVYEYNTQTAIQKIKTNQIDMALTVDLMDKPVFVEGLRLFSKPCVFAVCEDHPMAEMEQCTFQDLASQALILAKEDSYLSTQIKRRFQELGVEPESVFYTAQPSLIESMLSNRTSGAIVSEGLASKLPNVVCVPIEDPVMITHLLIWKRATHLPQGMKKFIREIKKVYPHATPY